MTNVVTLASRRAAPIPANLNAVQQMSRSGSSTRPPGQVGTANESAANPSDFDLVRLHMQAVNALSHALHQLNGPDCGPQMWAAATARAHRGLTALKQASALANRAASMEGGAL